MPVRVPADAGPDAALDAAVPDRNHDLVKQPTCSWPPGAPDPRNPACEPPHGATVVARIVSAKPDQGDLVIMVARGSDDLVDKTSRVELIDDNRRPIATTALAIVDVDRKVTTLRVTGPKSLPDGSSVRFSPR